MPSLGAPDRALGPARVQRVRIAFGADEANEVTVALVAHLRSQGHTVVVDCENEPWPDVGTPEWERIHAEQIDQEKRIEQLLRSICRGC